MLHGRSPVHVQRDLRADHLFSVIVGVQELRGGATSQGLAQAMLAAAYASLTHPRQLAPGPRVIAVLFGQLLNNS
jgi:hypothetical protein